MIEIFIKASSGRWLKASLLNVKRKAINTPCNTIRIQMFTVCTIPPPAKKLGVVQRLKPAKSNIYARPRAGFFFCLASSEDAGLLFCPTAIQLYTIVYRAFCAVYASYITNSAKQRTGLYMGVSVDLAHSSVHNTVTTQANYAPTAPHWRAYHQAQHLQHIPDTNAAPGRCTGQHRPPIIIMYIRGCNISQTMPDRRDQLLPSADRWQVLTRCQQSSSRRAAGGAEPLTATAVSLFGLSPDSQ